MDILIPDEWLRTFLKTKATTREIANSLSLCGPSVEKIIPSENGPVYSIEATTNRPDTASVYGIASEAVAILPRCGFPALLIPLRINLEQTFNKEVEYLSIKIDEKLCARFTAVLIKNVQIKTSPVWLIKRLQAVGVRPINNIVDISNYIMHELGQPVHTFDYDKIGKQKMILRESLKDETITTLDGKNHTLLGGDIVIEDGEGKLIDLAGIMGGLNSAVDQNTKNVLLFVQTYNPSVIRKTSMSLAHRTEASALFEKDLDPELVTLAIKRGIELFKKLTGGVPNKTILDIYPKAYRVKKIITSWEFITSRLGIEISQKETSNILLSLNFEPSWKGKILSVFVPSYRANDVNIPEDIIEEIARLYGYHNLPSQIMPGVLPNKFPDSPFSFEIEVKRILKSYGGIEVYTLSLVPKEYVTTNALKLKNPLGKESEYLRTSLLPSLITAASENKGEKEPFHLFEMANVYLQHHNFLPEEKMMLAGILSNFSFRHSKGIVETLLEELNIAYEFFIEDASCFLPNQRLIIKSGKTQLGIFGNLENELIYYEFEIELLRKVSQKVRAFKSLPKFPAQVEDLTLVFPTKTKIGEVISAIKKQTGRIAAVELKEIYQDSFTFRLYYQHPTKTLTDKEVEDIRTNLLKTLQRKFGGELKN